MQQMILEKLKRSFHAKKVVSLHKDFSNDKKYVVDEIYLLRL